MLIGRSYGGRPTMFTPSRVIFPVVGVSNPASMRSNVDLPQPEEPRSAKISPLAMSTDTSSTAATSSKRLLRLSMRTNCLSAGANWPGLSGLAIAFISHSSRLEKSSLRGNVPWGPWGLGFTSSRSMGDGVVANVVRPVLHRQYFPVNSPGSYGNDGKQTCHHQPAEQSVQECGGRTRLQSDPHLHSKKENQGAPYRFCAWPKRAILMPATPFL